MLLLLCEWAEMTGPGDEAADSLLRCPPSVPSMPPSSTLFPFLPRELQDLQDGGSLHQSHQVLPLPLQPAVLCKYVTPGHAALSSPQTRAAWVPGHCPERTSDGGMESPLPGGSLTTQRFLSRGLCLGWGWLCPLPLRQSGTAPQYLQFVLLLAPPLTCCLLQLQLEQVPNTPP